MNLAGNVQSLATIQQQLTTAQQIASNVTNWQLSSTASIVADLAAQIANASVASTKVAALQQMALQYQAIAQSAMTTTQSALYVKVCIIFL